MPVEQSRAIAAAVEKSGTPVWTLIARDEGHGFTKQLNVNYKFLAEIEFVEKYL